MTEQAVMPIDELRIRAEFHLAEAATLSRIIDRGVSVPADAAARLDAHEIALTHAKAAIAIADRLTLLASVVSSVEDAISELECNR